MIKTDPFVNKEMPLLQVFLYSFSKFYVKWYLFFKFIYSIWFHQKKDNHTWLSFLSFMTRRKHFHPDEICSDCSDGQSHHSLAIHQKNFPLEHPLFATIQVSQHRSIKGIPYRMKKDDRYDVVGKKIAITESDIQSKNHSCLYQANLKWLTQSRDCSKKKNRWHMK